MESKTCSSFWWKIDLGLHIFEVQVHAALHLFCAKEFNSGQPALTNSFLLFWWCWTWISAMVSIKNTSKCLGWLPRLQMKSWNVSHAFPFHHKASLWTLLTYFQRVPYLLIAIHEWPPRKPKTFGRAYNWFQRVSVANSCHYIPILPSVVNPRHYILILPNSCFNGYIYFKVVSDLQFLWRREVLLLLWF